LEKKAASACPLLAHSGHPYFTALVRFWGKADMPFALHMSAFDAKRTELRRALAELWRTFHLPECNSDKR
jgi:hypothetical protein